MYLLAMFKYSVDILNTLFLFKYVLIKSSHDFILSSSGIANTIFTFPYSKLVKISTSAFVSSTQSKPLIPTSYIP